MIALGFDLVSGECFCVRVEVFPYLTFSFLFLFCHQVIWDLEDFRAFARYLFSSALSNWVVHMVWNALGQRGSVWTGFGPVAFVAFGLCLGVCGRWLAAHMGCQQPPCRGVELAPALVPSIRLRM